MDRRTLLAMAGTPIVPAMSQPGIKVGDWIKVVATPNGTDVWASMSDPYWRRTAWKFRRAVGKTYQVLYVYEGKVAVDIGSEVAEATRALIVPMEFAPELIVRVPVPASERLAASEKLRATLMRYEELDALPAGVTLRSLLE